MLSCLYGPVRRPDSWWVIQDPLSESVHRARVIALAAVLVGITTLVPGTRLHAQQPLNELPLDEVRVLAEQGDAAAQTNLGVRYRFGFDVPQDEAESVRWYRLAADQGYPDAQLMLGGMYADGRGVPKDYAEAVRWYRAAAEQGDASGQLSLALMYSLGRGVPEDEAEAVRWFRLAADQGHAGAQSSLGRRYTTGDGVARDDAEAVRWWTLAADQGYAEAQLNLAFMYLNGRGVSQDPAEAERWYRIAAEQPGFAMGYISSLYGGGASGRGGPVVFGSRPTRGTRGHRAASGVGIRLGGGSRRTTPRRFAGGRSPPTRETFSAQSCGRSGLCERPGCSSRRRQGPAVVSPRR